MSENHKKPNKPFVVRIGLDDFAEMDKLIEKGRVVNRSEFIRGAVGLALSLTNNSTTEESMITNYSKVGAVNNLKLNK